MSLDRCIRDIPARLACIPKVRQNIPGGCTLDTIARIESAQPLLFFSFVLADIVCGDCQPDDSRHFWKCEDVQGVSFLGFVDRREAGNAKGKGLFNRVEQLRLVAFFRHFFKQQDGLMMLAKGQASEFEMETELRFCHGLGGVSEDNRKLLIGGVAIAIQLPFDFIRHQAVSIALLVGNDLG